MIISGGLAQRMVLYGQIGLLALDGTWKTKDGAYGTRKLVRI